MQNNIYSHSRYSPEEFSHGGCKRTAQIQEILFRHDVLFKNADFEQYINKSKSITAYLQGINYQKQLTRNIRNDHTIGQYLKAFNKFAKEKKTELFIWESVSEYYLLLVEVLHSKKIPVIAVPHNIESLVKWNISFTSGIKSPHWFNEELKYLKYANKVFTISQEEQWLLSLYDINADYLPYYPTENVKKFLLTIREEKAKQQGKKDQIVKKVLLLGTFHNGPTIQGYINLLHHISIFKNIVIDVAGFGAENIKHITSSNITIRGSVSNEELKQLIVENDIAIIHQIPTSGALTKIPELLIAGMPIIANETASRSYFNVNGVSTYYNYDELYTLINSISLELPEIPVAPLQAEKRFIDTIKNITLSK